MSYGEICDKKIKIYEKLPINCEIPYEECKCIEIQCRLYVGHKGKCGAVVVDVGGHHLGHVEWDSLSNNIKNNL